MIIEHIQTKQQYEVNPEKRSIRKLEGNLFIPEDTEMAKRLYRFAKEPESESLKKRFKVVSA